MRPGGRTDFQPRTPLRQTYETFKPKSEWKYEDDATILLIYLPGFEKEQIWMKFTFIDNVTLGIKVEGKHPLLRGKWRQFTEIYKIPKICDVNKITSNFESGLFTVVMPKAVEAKNVSADKEENKATPEISSAQEKAETSAVEKQREEEDVETLSPKKVTSEEKSEKGQEETSSKTSAFVDTAEKIDEKRVGSGGESVYEKADVKKEKSEEIEKEKAAEAEKPESSAEKSKEFSAALEAVVTPKTEEKEKTDCKSEKSVDSHLEEKCKKDTIDGKSKDKEDESASASASEGWTEMLLLNMGTAVLVIMGLWVSIIYSVGSFGKAE